MEVQQCSGFFAGRVVCETSGNVANQSGSCCCGESGVWWSGVDRPRQAFDDGVVGVYDPASGFGMANGTVVLEKQVHRLLFTAASKFGALTPGK